MRVTLIRPDISARKKRRGFFSDNLEPLELAILAGLTPPEVDLTLFDDRLEEIDYHHQTDLVALTVLTHTARRAYEIAGKFRQRGVPVVMGGIHPTLLPDEAGGYADAVVVGEAESTWPQVVQDAAQGSLKPLYRAEEFSDLRGLRPRREIYAGRSYSPMSIVEFGRGCPHGCEFCSGATIYRRKVRHRPVREVIEEIQSLPRHQDFYFTDDNLYACKQAAQELLQALIPLRKKWAAQVHLDFTGDEHFMRLMAESGCTSVFIGLESLNAQNLNQMNKKGTLTWYRESLAKIRRFGFCIYGSFMFGYDEDREETFDETLRFALEERFFAALFTPLQPFPGTPLLARLKEAGRMLYDTWWIDPGFRYQTFAFRPEHLPPDSINHCRRVQEKFYSWPSIARRALDRRANARSLSHFLLFLAYNGISRRVLKRNPWFELHQ
ncbi:MAG: B12-binding domain-containing radical SAM protein [bacterium]